MVKEPQKKVKKITKKSKKNILISYQLEKLNNIVSNFEKNISEFEILLKNKNLRSYENRKPKAGY